MKKSILLILALVCAVAQGAWAQGQFGDLPKTVSASDVEVTEVRYLQFMSHDSLVVNTETGTIDTLHINDGQKILTEEEYHQLAQQPAKARRRIAGVTPNTDEYGGFKWEGYQYFGSSAELYSYKYPSIDANGEKVVLSALMGVPTKIVVDGVPAKPNNVVIGCHETITSNYECPTNYNHGGSAQSGNGMLLEFCRYDYVRQPCCLVILADYEGYGCTADRPHPYLYQELTARQVVDAVRYGLALYNTRVGTSNYEFARFEDDWKSVCIGFSQGGSVALATHKFIETNNLSEELHFAGSVCGDGPYDPIAHLRYYMEDNGRTYHVKDGVEQKTAHEPGTISMPIVMPLILKGMCDSNPLMRQHNLKEYLSDRFFATSSTFMLESKSKANAGDQYSTERINKVYRACRKNNVTKWEGNVHNPYGEDFTVGGSYTLNEMAEMLFKDDGDNVWGKMEHMLSSQAYEYFNNINNFVDKSGKRKTPTGRGTMEDLHRALESNNLTVGWTPQHRIAFYHSTYDTVVPYDNLLSFIKNHYSLTYYTTSNRCFEAGLRPNTTTAKSNANVFIYDDPTANDHVGAGSDFFFFGSSMVIAGITPDYWLFKWVLTGDN